MEGRKSKRKEEAEKAYIIKRFRLYGVCANKDTDVDQSDRRGTSHVARATTVVVRGATHLLDYWSTNNNRVNLVLKKFKATKDTIFQPKLTSSKRGHGDTIADEWNGQMIWQIVPYHCRDTVIPLEAYCWHNGKTITKKVDKVDRYNQVVFNAGGDTPVQIEVVENDPMGARVGYYWRIGNVHEYPDLPHIDSYSRRTELSGYCSIT